MATTVKLKFVDVLGLPLDDHTVTVDVYSLDNAFHVQAVVPLDGQTDVAINLNDCPQGIYRFQLSPTNYQIIQFFLSLSPEDTVVRQKPVVFPVDPGRVIDIEAPAFADLPSKLQAFLTSARIQARDGSIPAPPASVPSGNDLYTALVPELKAALLNLFVKSANTVLADGTTCFDHLRALQELHQDRLFATVEAALLEETMDSTKFHSADHSLHRGILGYNCFCSFKTLDRQGNLQLTFSRKGATGNDYLVDMDIDDARGIGHLFEVVHNMLAGPTNPYQVREILMAAQGLKPLYTFVFSGRKGASQSGAH